MCAWRVELNIEEAKHRLDIRVYLAALLTRLPALLRGDCVALFFSSCRYRSQTVNIPEAADYGAKQKYLSDSDELPCIIYWTSTQQTISVCEVPQL